MREKRRGQDGRPTQQPDGHDRDHERPGGADGAPEDLRLEILEPGTSLVPSGSISDRGGEDPLVQVRGRWWSRQAAEQREQPARPADLGRAGRASPHMGGEARGVLLGEIVHEERVDQAACGRVIEGLAGGPRLAHIL